MNNSGWAVSTLEAALWAFNSTSTFEDALIAAVNVGDHLRVRLCDSDVVAVEDPGSGLVGYLVHPDTPKIRRLVEDRREIKAIVASFDDVGEPSMRMNVVIADVTEE